MEMHRGETGFFLFRSRRPVAERAHSVLPHRREHTRTRLQHTDVGGEIVLRRACGATNKLWREVRSNW